MWLQRAEKHFSHGRCQLWRPWKKQMKRCPNATHHFSISASVFSFLFFLFFTLLFVFSSLLGKELLTSGSAAWCFLAAVKLHRSQLSSADTFFSFFNHANVHARSVSEHDEALTSSLSIKAPHTNIGLEGSCAETITNQTCARNKHNSGVQHLSWTSQFHEQKQDALKGPLGCHWIFYLQIKE